MLFQNSIGVDIHKNGVAVVHLKGTVKGPVIGNAMYHAFENEMELPQKIGKISELLSDFTKEQNLTAPEIFIGLPREMIMMRDIQFPLAVKENLKSTLKYEMEKYVPISADEIYFDYQIVGEKKDSKQMTVLLLVVKRNEIQPFLQLDHDLGFGLSGIEISSTALTNFFYDKTLNDKNQLSDDKPYLLIYIAYGHYEVDILENNRLKFSKSGILKSDMELLSQEMLEVLNTCLGRYQDVNPELLFSGDKNYTGVVGRIQQAIGRPINTIDFDLDGLEDRRMTPACGLALKAFSKPPMQINFVPLHLRRKPQKTGLYMMLILILLTAILGGVWFASYIATQKIAINELNRDIANVQKEVAQVDQLRTDIDLKEKYIDQINEFTTGSAKALEILKEMTEKIPKTAYLKHLSISGNTVEIDGYADSARELIPLLEASPFFKDVGFLSSITKKNGRETFQIKLKTISPNTVSH